MDELNSSRSENFDASAGPFPIRIVQFISALVYPAGYENEFIIMNSCRNPYTGAPMNIEFTEPEKF